jgi:uncharacterized protein (TIGR00730 family)
MTAIPPSVCVFCGSRNGASAVYAADAQDLGARFAARGWRLVYGAGDVGIMGQVARAAITGGAQTFGVIPTHLMQSEQGKRNLATLVVTETMHERKKVMFANSDAIVVLPGGAGTLDEFFEVLTWAQLALHRHPIIVLNTDGFWTPLVALVDHIIAQGFAEPSLKAFFKVVETVEQVEALLAAHFADRAAPLA